MEYHPRYGTMVERAARIEVSFRDARRNQDGAEKIRARIEIWEATPGPTGMTADVYVDGKRIGAIGNLKRRETLELGDLAKGQHVYALKRITGYYVLPDGSKGAVFLRGAECAGSFDLEQDTTFDLMVRSAGGRVVCGLQAQ
jgi:hypothetical protein